MLALDSDNDKDGWIKAYDDDDTNCLLVAAVVVAVVGAVVQARTWLREENEDVVVAVNKRDKEDTTIDE